MAAEKGKENHTFWERASAVHVLFISLRNLCRSPLAEAMLRIRAQDAGVQLTADSAATSAWQLDGPCDPRAVVAAREYGFEIKPRKTRLLGSDDFAPGTLIIAMDHHILATVKKRQPQDAGNEVRLLSEFADPPTEEEIVDPYYSGQFDPVIAQIDRCMPGLVAYLAAAH